MAKNSPSEIRTSFINYLQHDFPHANDWEHPSTQVIYSHKDVEEKLMAFKKIDSQRYRALWYLWTTQETRAYIANALNFSPPTIKRMWSSSIDTVLLMLLYPHLTPEHFSLFKTTY
jgi:hypothetical protein